MAGRVNLSLFYSLQKKKMDFFLPIRAYTKARVQSYGRCRDASANDRPRHPYIPGQISIFIPFVDGTAEERRGVRVDVGGGEGEVEGSRCQIRNASELTSRFDATQTLRPIIRSLPPFFGFHAHCTSDPYAAENAHRVFTRLSVLARFVVHFWCCSACRNRHYTIKRYVGVVWIVDCPLRFQLSPTISY